MTTTCLTFPSLLSSLLQRPLFALCQAVTDLLSLLLRFVSWSFFPFGFFAGLRCTTGGPNRIVLILGDSQATFDQHSEHYSHPFIDPRLLDRRLTQPSS